MRRHPDLSQWTDFARDVFADASVRRRLARHLDGCKRCREVVASLRRVMAAARAEERDRAPGYALHTIRALCGLRRSLRNRETRPLVEGLRAVWLQAPAGVRGDTEEGSRLFESPEWALDLRLDRRRRACTWVVGQLLGRRGRPVERVPVYLVDGPEVVAAGCTREFGAFRLETDRRLPLELRLLVEDRRSLAVPLTERPSG